MVEPVRARVAPMKADGVEQFRSGNNVLTFDGDRALVNGRDMGPVGGSVIGAPRWNQTGTAVAWMVRDGNTPVVRVVRGVPDEMRDRTFRLPPDLGAGAFLWQSASVIAAIKSPVDVMPLALISI